MAAFNAHTRAVAKESDTTTQRSATQPGSEQAADKTLLHAPGRGSGWQQPVG
jgi:hypothetical protein